MDVRGWLLEGDPSITWQVRSALMNGDGAGSDRVRVATEGWGAELLGHQEPDGQWGGGFYSPKWISTTYTLLLLRHYGLDPGSPQARSAVERLVNGGRSWKRVVDGRTDAGFFEYIGETCVTAMNVALACYFQAMSARTLQAVDFLLDQQMDDGGWNCQSVNGSKRSSFHTTISTLEALLEFESSDLGRQHLGTSAAARAAANQYLLERRFMRSLTTGEIIEKRWKLFSFPPRWWYDVLRGLDYMRSARVVVDERWDEALDLVQQRKDSDGRWKLQNRHPGKEHFRMEESGRPSRWNTLRAMRVLRYAGRDG